MKKIFTMLLVLVAASNFAQQYEIDEYNGQTVQTCSGTFYDSGGGTAGYLDGENYQITFCSFQTESQIVFSFTEFKVENGFENFRAYDGIGTGGTLLGNWTNTALQDLSLSSINSGCLTFVFTSDGSVSGSSGFTGWEAEINCSFQCQTFNVEINNISLPWQTGDTLHICQDELISFSAVGVYPENDSFYSQHDSSTTFIWAMGNGATCTGQTVVYSFPEEGFFMVSLTATDVNGCISSYTASKYIQVSLSPDFSAVSASSDTVAPGDTVWLNGFVPDNEYVLPPQILIEEPNSVFIPDDASGHYYSEVTALSFPPGSSIQTVDDIVGLCINMEHSYMGDLTMKFICPNGQFINLFEYPNGCGPTFLGEPIDNDADLLPGIGYDYCWTPYAESTTTDTCGFFSTLPAGDYLPETPWESLLGCPLYGTWTLEVFDNIGSDNGYIFNWAFEVNYSSINDSTVIFTSTFPDSLQSWSTTNGNLINNLGSEASAVNSILGEYYYTFSVVDDLGCEYDTTIQITVKYPCQTFSANLTTNADYVDGDTIHICTGDSLLMTATGTYPNNFTNYFQHDNLTQFFMDFGDGSIIENTHSAIHQYNNPGGYILSLRAEDNNFCENSNLEELYIVVSPPPDFSGLSANPTTVTLGEQIVLSGYAGSVTWTHPTLSDWSINYNYDVNNSYWDCNYSGFDITNNLGGNLIASCQQAGNYYFQYHVSDYHDCWFDTTILIVVINDTLTTCQQFSIESSILYPTISGDTIYLCQGDSVNIFVSGNYFNNDSIYNQSDQSSIFLWDNGQNGGSSGQYFSQIYDDEGAYKIELTSYDTLLCPATEVVEFNVQVMLSPIFNNSGLSADTIHLGDTLWLTGEALSPVWQHPVEGWAYTNSYSVSEMYWSSTNGNENFINMQNGNATCVPLASGDYIFSFHVIDNIGCSYSTDFQAYVVYTLSISVLNSALHIYPNPFNDEIFIDYSGPNEEKLKIELFDIFGKQVSYTSIDASKGRYTISCNTLAAGVYLMKISSVDGILNHKLVKAD